MHHRHPLSQTQSFPLYHPASSATHTLLQGLHSHQRKLLHHEE
uniref:Uncharacterized protein n=1 Tax=Anguilla anguilla TaxID=7936 RepID=A0A0E9SCF4_ANGAN